MKKLLLGLCMVAALTGCTSRTEYGSCVGVNDTQDPALHYKVSSWNVAMGIIFIETIIAPIVVVNDQLYCPVGKQQATKGAV